MTTLPIMPISPFDIYPDYGRINENGEFTIDRYNQTYEKYKLGIFYDIYCVALGKKSLAAVNLTTEYGIQYVKDCIKGNIIDIEIALKVKQYLNQVNIHFIQWCGEGNYLRNIYYSNSDKNGFENAMKLALILHTDYYDLNELEYHIAIGLLLGYKLNRIKGFILRNVNYRIYLVDEDDILPYINDTRRFIEKLSFEKKYVIREYPIKIKQGITIKLT